MLIIKGEIINGGEKSVRNAHSRHTVGCYARSIGHIITPMMINPVQCSSHLLNMSNIETFCADAGVTSCCDVTQGEGSRLLETVTIAVMVT